VNYRSLSDLNHTLVAGLWELPSDVRLVAGVPRSGMIPAALLSLYLDVPLTDTQSLLEGRVLGTGYRFTNKDEQGLPPGSRVLIVDDSILSGQEMVRQRTLLEPLKDRYQLHFLAVYGVRGQQIADQILEIVPELRVFEWNIIHSPHIERACVDIDGVLCRDPLDEENDDGPRYREFIANAEPRWLPSRTIGWLVTSRLEKYRALTVEWLQKHGVRYGELLMVDLPDKRTRNLVHSHAGWKGCHYRSVPSPLFIESSAAQASEIARVSGKSVWSLENRQMHQPGRVPAVVGALMEPRIAAVHGVGSLRRSAGRLFRAVWPRRQCK
jgi:orotate phosphoribosyltransferase